MFLYILSPVKKNSVLVNFTHFFFQISKYKIGCNCIKSNSEYKQNKTCNVRLILNAFAAFSLYLKFICSYRSTGIANYLISKRYFSK